MGERQDLISRKDAIDVLNIGTEILRRVLDDTEDVVGVEREKYKWGLRLIESYVSDIKELPSAQPEYEPVNAEDFAKTMSKNTLYGFWAWYGKALALMNEMGVRDKKDDAIYRQAVIDAFWKSMYKHEDKTEKQFQKSGDLDVEDWNRIFAQNMNDIDRQTILNLPSAQPHLITDIQKK